MYKFTLALSLLFYGSNVFGCDVCGNAGNSFSLGFMPNSNHHVIGMRSQMRYFDSKVPDHPKTQEFFSTNELYGRFKIRQKIQILAFVPYVRNVQFNTETELKSSGLGDVSALVNYVFFDNTDSISKAYKHSGTIGFGIKTPTGNSKRDVFSQRNFLPGSGSLDFFANINYSLQRKSVGYLFESSFSYKTENREGYRFGNTFSSSHLCFYKFSLPNQQRFIPQLGFNYNVFGQDREHGSLSDETFNGGFLLNAQLNLNYLTAKWLFSASCMKPVVQNLNSGYVTQNVAFRFTINYYISQKKS